MGMKMLCPFCEEEGKTPPTVKSWEEAKEYLEEHGASEEQIEQARKNWQTERAAWRHERIAYKWSTI